MITTKIRHSGGWQGRGVLRAATEPRSRRRRRSMLQGTAVHSHDAHALVKVDYHSRPQEQGRLVIPALRRQAGARRWLRGRRRRAKRPTPCRAAPRKGRRPHLQAPRLLHLVEIRDAVPEPLHDGACQAGKGRVWGGGQEGVPLKGAGARPSARRPWPAAAAAHDLPLGCLPPGLDAGRAPGAPAAQVPQAPLAWSAGRDGALRVGSLHGAGHAGGTQAGRLGLGRRAGAFTAAASVHASCDAAQRLKTLIAAAQRPFREHEQRFMAQQVLRCMGLRK